ncbi:DMT family transporter [Shimazuella sp. AN120528]|uniref:DMT family transporter n=1 Tax=Shimazuella soli TaxID=1892854 RepID=UPI001F0DCA29|nr:DMT family transporter [Shimazuella soli]MCH5586574.1 DMT family transporter [Shimazuella soli]
MIRIVSLIITVTLIWGYTWVTMKIGLHDIPPFLFSSLRLLIGGLTLFGVQGFMKKPLFPNKSTWKNIIIMSLFMSIGYMGLLTFGMQFVNSGQSSVLVYTMPIIVSLLAHFLLNEKLNTIKIIGLIIGVIGLVSILGQSLLNLHMDSVFFGKILILCSALSWALANIFTKARLAGSDIVLFTAWQLLLGAILLFGISSLTESTKAVTWTTSSISTLLFNGIFSTAFTFVAWFWILEKIKASVASITLMAVPILGLFFGWLQLGEPITVNIVVGAILICIGIFFGSVKLPRKENKEILQQGRTD